MPNCPHCHKDDQVFHVRAIYDSGTQITMTTSGGLVFANGIAPIAIGERSFSQTELAKRLSPPQEPSPKNILGMYPAWYSLVIFWGWILGSSLTVVFGGEKLILLAFVIFLSGPVILYMFQRRNDQYKAKQYHLLLQEHYRKITEWEQSYYCYRDDTVFMP